LDPFFGSGTVGVVCQELGRDFIGIELHPEYVSLADKRLSRAARKADIFNELWQKTARPVSTHAPSR
jgi:DNA modification methylase